MRWEDERYIRFYTRNPPEWCVMKWQSRGLMGLILREVDRAGILELGKLGLRAVAVAVRAPWEEIEAPLHELLEDGCVVFREDLRVLVVPNFIDAQEAPASDKARQRAARERARDIARARSLLVTPPIQSVTEAHAVGQRNVTEAHADRLNGHSVPSVPSVPNPPSVRGARVPDETSPEAQRPEPPEPPKPETAFDAAQRIYSEAFRKRYRREFMLTSYGHKGTDEWAFVNVGRLAESKGDRELWLRHWFKLYLRDDDRFIVDNAHAPRFLERRLNKYGEPKKPKPAEPKPEPAPEPQTGTRPFVPLEPVLDAAPLRKASTPDELKAKAEADKARLAASFGGKQ
jgi:hypothetical protein